MEHVNAKPWPWSPAVVSKVEIYAVRPKYLNSVGFDRPLEHRKIADRWQVTLDGRSAEFFTREDAERIAEMLVDPKYVHAREDWRTGIWDAEAVEGFLEVADIRAKHTRNLESVLFV